MTLILVKGICRAGGRYIVQARWPYGSDPDGYGEVVCATLDDVLALVRACDVNPILAPKEESRG